MDLERERRLKETKEIIQELIKIHSQGGIPTERIALDCKVQNNSVKRWFCSLKRDNVKVMQSAPMFLAKRFIERYREGLISA